tara:strand:- start:4507 stop:5037 length:531 start_codon:yes stop_codon:yes gene_type:complete
MKHLTILLLTLLVSGGLWADDEVALNCSWEKEERLQSDKWVEESFAGNDFVLLINKNSLKVSGDDTYMEWRDLQAIYKTRIVPDDLYFWGFCTNAYIDYSLIDCSLINSVSEGNAYQWTLDRKSLHIKRKQWNKSPFINQAKMSSQNYGQCSLGDMEKIKDMQKEFLDKNKDWIKI